MAENKILTAIKGLGVGDRIAFPIERTPYVRNACGMAAYYVYGARFSARIDKQAGLVWVERILRPVPKARADVKEASAGDGDEAEPSIDGDEDSMVDENAQTINNEENDYGNYCD